MNTRKNAQGLKLEFSLSNPHSLHARPAARLAQTARQFKSDIILSSDTAEVDAKSMLDILSLAPDPNVTLRFYANGPDASEALDALKSVIQSLDE